MLHVLTAMSMVLALLVLADGAQEALDSPQLRMESERLDQTPLSLIKSYGSSPPQHQRLSQQLEHELLHADYEVDVIANIRLPHTELLLSQDQEEEQEGQHKGASADVNSPGVGGSSYVGVDKVPGRTRWPYRATLSLPTWSPAPDSPSHSSVVIESFYSTPEAAARAVDAICIVLLGQQAALNFPASSYDAADLEDASKYIRCISGGARFCSSCGCAAVRVGAAAAAAASPTA